MDEQAMPRRPRLWIYTILPAAILNIGVLILYGGYYALAAVRPAAVSAIAPGAVRLTVDALIVVVEWAFALGVILWLRRNGLGLRALLCPQGRPLGFRWGPAMVMFLALNALMALYMVALARLYGDLSAQYAGLSAWARLAQVLLVSITAAFCEELIWRGHVQTQLRLGGRSPRRAILLMALSFAAIHGLFFPDKLVMTFVYGLIAGWYYQREGNLLPLMATHLFVDLWSFGLAMLGVF